MTLTSIVLTLALLILIGLVVDGGAKLRAGREATAIAEEAARAGTGQIDPSQAYAGIGRFLLDRTRAIRAARSYLTTTGHTGTVTAVGTDSIRVTVTVTRPTIMLSLVGIGSVHTTGTATADLVQGVERPAP